MHQKQAMLLRGLLAASLFILSTNVVAQESVSGFEQALEKTGWSVERNAAGELLLMPQQSDTDNAAPTGIDMDKLSSELKASGWDVQRKADGSLILIPQAPSANDQEKIPAPEDPWQQLRDTGWQVLNNSDGSVLLYPPEETVLGKARPCPGTAPSVAVTLPVDSWQEAYDITQGWLNNQPNIDAKVGKIRQIFNVYLVSIIARQSPNKLLQQVAIRNGDGAVIVLN